MRIIAKCPRCSYRWWLDATAVDRRLRCRKCFMFLRVPNLIEVPNAAEVINHAKSDLYVDDTGRTYG